MSGIFSNMDPQTMATQLASYDILKIKTQLKKQSDDVAAQNKALTTLKEALDTFKTAMSALNKSKDGVLKNSASVDRENVANVTADSTARKGSYQISVSQLAAAQQTAYDQLTDDAVKKATGNMVVSIGDKKLTIDMDKVSSLADLQKAINNDKDNPGVTASIIRSDGKVQFTLSSNEMGVKNGFNLDTSGLDAGAQAVFAQTSDIATATDAKFKIGNLELTSSSNTLKNVVDGVTIELKTVTDKPFTVSVTTDSGKTKEQVQALVDAWNKLSDALDDMTKSGEKGKGRGAFAGDATISSLRNDLNNMLRSPIDGKNITQFGISADRAGKLQIDSTAFDKQLKANPESFNAFFNDTDGLFNKVDKSLDRYLNSSKGLLKGRQDTLNRKQKQIDSDTEKMNARYETAYGRYLAQFTQLQKTMTQMQNTMSMFGLS